MSEILKNIYPINAKAVVLEESEVHKFYKGEIVNYLKSIKRSSGEIWHQFSDDEGYIYNLIDGEFKIIIQ